MQDGFDVNRLNSHWFDRFWMSKFEPNENGLQGDLGL
jgi:hypothetical protein